MLRHSSIVQVFDFGCSEEGVPFLVMELLRGKSLATSLDHDGRLGPVDAVRCLLPIADGLVAAHAENIVHRDVKPDNIFIALNGALKQPKLLDFGLARHNGSGLGPRRLTDVGAVLGTPAYLSPEQASGLATIDGRADVWAFCATLYECVTGVVPFQAITWPELRQQILDDEPRTICDFGLGEVELWEILKTGLSKSPAERWPTMQTLGSALARWLLQRNVTSDVCGVSLEARWVPSRPPATSPAPQTAPPQGSRDEVTSDEGLPRRAAGLANTPNLTEELASTSHWQRPRRVVLGAAMGLAFAGAGAILGAAHMGRVANPRAAAPHPSATRAQLSQLSQPSRPPSASTENADVREASEAKDTPVAVRSSPPHSKPTPERNAPVSRVYAGGARRASLASAAPSERGPRDAVDATIGVTVTTRLQTMPPAHDGSTAATEERDEQRSSDDSLDLMVPY